MIQCPVLNICGIYVCLDWPQQQFYLFMFFLFTTLSETVTIVMKPRGTGYFDATTDLHFGGAYFESMLGNHFFR